MHRLISESLKIFSGQTGPDLTADWFEITNRGDTAWMLATNNALYYDDESASAVDADPILGLTQIDPGQAAIVVIGDSLDAMAFFSVWSTVADLTGIEIGYSDGAGLGGGGDAVNIWIGDPMLSDPIASGAYPSTSANDGQSYDVELAAFSIVGNSNNAVQTVLLGGNAMVPNVASPGNQGPAQLDPNAPLLVADSIAAAPYLLLPVNGPATIGADLGENYGRSISFQLSDADTPLSEVSLSASSNNETVVPNDGLTFSGNTESPVLTIAPAGVGFGNIDHHCDG